MNITKLIEANNYSKLSKALKWPRDEGFMHARSALLGKSLPCLMLPLFALFCASENYANFCDASDLPHGHSERSSAKKGDHRPVDNGHRPNMGLSAKHF